MYEHTSKTYSSIITQYKMLVCYTIGPPGAAKLALDIIGSFLSNNA